MPTANLTWINNSYSFPSKWLSSIRQGHLNLMLWRYHLGNIALVFEQYCSSIQPHILENRWFYTIIHSSWIMDHDPVNNSIDLWTIRLPIQLSVLKSSRLHKVILISYWSICVKRLLMASVLFNNEELKRDRGDRVIDPDHNFNVVLWS